MRFLVDESQPFTDLRDQRDGSVGSIAHPAAWPLEYVASARRDALDRTGAKAKERRTGPVRRTQDLRPMLSCRSHSANSRLQES